MSQRPTKKYMYDISFGEGAGAQLVSWVTGLMVFFVTLALIVNFSLSAVTANWVTGLSGALTVEVKPPMPSNESMEVTAQQEKKFHDDVRKIVAFLKDNASVAEARLLTEKEVKTLMEPWLGQGVTLDSIGLPALIDVKLKANADVMQLEGDLKAADPNATIDSHTDTLDDIKSVVDTATLFVLLLTGVIVVLAVVAISSIVRSKLMIHRQEVETLHLIGASDEYIARQFRRFTLRGSLKGAFFGIVFILLALLAISSVTDMLNSTIFMHVEWAPVQWAMLIVIPIAAASLIAHLTAQATVLKELSKLT